MHETQIIIPMSQALKDAIGTEASVQGKSMARYVREVLAKSCNYDLAKEPKVRKVRKYANAEERKAVYREKARERRRIARELLEEYYRQQALEDVRKARER